VGQEAGYFQNQPPRKLRKRGIAALLADVTNQPSGRRICKEETIEKVHVSTTMIRDLEPRGDAVKGGKARSKSLKEQASHPDDTCTLYSIYTKDREIFDKGQDYISNFVSKNVSWEVQKPLLFT
jgi:hypothetical protein